MLLRPLTVTKAQVAVNQWRRIALASTGNPDGDDDRPPPDPEHDNRLQLSQTFEGRWRLDGDLDAVSGQIVSDAIDAVIDAMFRDGTATAADGVLRSHRKAQALVGLVGRGSEPGTEQGQARPSVSLVLDAAEYDGVGADGPDEAQRRRCELADGTPIARSTAERLLCDASITALLTRTGLNGIVEVAGSSCCAGSITTPSTKAASRWTDHRPAPSPSPDPTAPSSPEPVRAGRSSTPKSPNSRSPLSPQPSAPCVARRSAPPPGSAPSPDDETPTSEPPPGGARPPSPTPPVSAFPSATTSVVGRPVVGRPARNLSLSDHPRPRLTGRGLGRG